MSEASTRTLKLGRPKSIGPAFDKYIFLPIFACAFAEIISPLLGYADTGPMEGGGWTQAQERIIMAVRLENKIFWPVMAAISLILVIPNWSRLTLPPHIKVLFVYLALAGVSISWAFKPEFSLVRFLQQAMIITSIVLPVLLAARTVDLMRGLFLCFAFALILNLYFVLTQTPMIFQNGRIAYQGYFTFKGILGECAAIAILLSLHEILYPGLRRALGVTVIGIAVYLIALSDSNGSIALVLVAPFLAGFVLFIAKKMRVSPAIVLSAIPVIYYGLSIIVANLVNRISWYLYGNYTLSGRTYIWDFAKSEIARSPLVGWGYQSFWLVGPDAPSIVDAPGFIKTMPSSHNGYLDAQVDLGYVGLALLVTFIFATLHAIGRVAEREPARAWPLLTIALYVILTNFLETGWMHGADMLWIMFLIVVAEAGRNWQPLPASLSKPLSWAPAVLERRPGKARAQGSGKLGRFQGRRT
jgi:O-antigen ligase